MTDAYRFMKFKLYIRLMMLYNNSFLCKGEWELKFLVKTKKNGLEQSSSMKYVQNK